jgi:hypothetical protein
MSSIRKATVMYPRVETESSPTESSPFEHPTRTTYSGCGVRGLCRDRQEAVEIELVLRGRGSLAQFSVLGSRCTGAWSEGASRSLIAVV